MKQTEAVQLRACHRPMMILHVCYQVGKALSLKGGDGVKTTTSHPSKDLIWV